MRPVPRALTVLLGPLLAAAVLPMVLPSPTASPTGAGFFLGRAEAATKAERKAAREQREAEQARQREEKGKPEPQVSPPPPPPPVVEPLGPPPQPIERVEADVSTRSVAVTAAFRGTEIVVFGSVDNSRQSSAEAGYYDVVVVVEGRPERLTIRRKSNVGGLWINTAAAVFQNVPSYYAIASTRPIEEITTADNLRKHEIGFENVRFESKPGDLAHMTGAELKDYQAAAARLKEDDGLFAREDTGVAFIGRSLFRSSIELPANIPVGQLTARVYLFRDGELLSELRTKVGLERKGLELFLFDFAQERPLMYGCLAVSLALLCGFAASALFNRQQT